jgi:hypothetical protein
VSTRAIERDKAPVTPARRALSDRGPPKSLPAGLLLALGDADCLLTVADVARRLRLSKASVYKLVAEGAAARADWQRDPVRTGSG